MGKIIQSPSDQLRKRRTVAQLRGKRSELARQIARVDAQISKLQPARKTLTPKQLDQLLDDLSAGLPALSPLPPDFSRADLYEDHD